MILYSQNLREETILEGTQVEKTKSYIVERPSAASSTGSIRFRIWSSEDICKHFTKALGFIKTGGFNDYSVLSETTIPIIREIITLDYLYY